jgi:hypothetical protein
MQFPVNEDTDTTALRTALDGAGFESVDVLTDVGVVLDVPDGVDVLPVQMLARSVYMDSLLAAATAASAGSAEFKSAVVDMLTVLIG